MNKLFIITLTALTLGACSAHEKAMVDGAIVGATIATILIN